MDTGNLCGVESLLASKAPVPGPRFSPRSARGRRMMGLRASRPSNVVHAVRERPQPNQRRLLSGFGVVRIGRRDQAGDEGAEERLPAAPGVVDELEEAEIGGQLLLRDPPMWP